MIIKLSIIASLQVPREIKPACHRHHTMAKHVSHAFQTHELKSLNLEIQTDPIDV